MVQLSLYNSLVKVFEKIRDLLDSALIEYVHKEHAPTYSSQEASEVRGDDLRQGAKALLLKIESEYSLFVFAADRKLNSKKIKTHYKTLGKKARKVRFAHKEELFELTELVPGSVPPFGRPVLPFDLYVDPSLLDNEKISFNAGSLTHSISMNLKDYILIAKPIVFPFVD